jgi:hypothetical protein
MTMLPDEIIKHKEWNELTAAEKEAVLELAKNEQEYYVLKKMLQVSSEAVSDVPKAPERIRENIKSGLAGKSKRTRWYWYAAAAVLVIAIGSVLYFDKKDANDQPGNDLSIRHDKATKKTVEPVSAIDSAETAGKPGSQPVRGLKEPKEAIPSDSAYHTLEIVYTAVSVSDQKELLDLITEIY